MGPSLITWSATLFVSLSYSFDICNKQLFQQCVANSTQQSCCSGNKKRIVRGDRRRSNILMDAVIMKLLVVTKHFSFASAGISRVN